MKLPEYNDFIDKDLFYNSSIINTKTDFDACYLQLKLREDYKYRGVCEAKYKNYTSGQRTWITKDLGYHIDYVNFIDKILTNIRNNNTLRDYYLSLNIHPNDLLYLTYLQHYGAPTPMLDFTSDIDTGLFFAFDGVKENTTNRPIEDYVSLYYFSMAECHKEVANIIDVLGDGLVRAETMLEEFIKDNPKTSVDASLIEQVDELTKWLKPYPSDGLSAFDCGLLDNPLQANKLVMYKTGQRLLWSNLNIIAQKGSLLMYRGGNDPFEVYVYKNKYIPKLHCLNIHKSLADYIKKIINKKKEDIYPEEEKIAKDALQTYLDKLV